MALDDTVFTWAAYYAWLFWELLYGSHVAFCDPWITYFVVVSPEDFWSTIVCHSSPQFDLAWMIVRWCRTLLV